MLLKKDEFLRAIEYGELFFRRYVRLHEWLDEPEWYDLLGCTMLEIKDYTYEQCERVYYRYLHFLHSEDGGKSNEN